MLHASDVCVLAASYGRRKEAVDNFLLFRIWKKAMSM
jgi:hypothetical protein